MPLTSFAKRYAQAVFEIALESNKLEEWRSDLGKIAQLMGDAEFAVLVENPRLPTNLKEELAQEKLGKINLLALNLVYLLMAKGRLKHADQIANEYGRLLDAHYGITHAEVTTAIPLNDTDKQRLSHQLDTIVGKKVSVNLQIDPDILGGFIARIGDSLIDGSIRNRLNELKKSLAETRG